MLILRLTFCGAARQVTGSCFLLETASARFLVDCGMFQGNKATRARNLQPFAFDPRSIDFVILTHAHIDHSGLLPRLQAQGFSGAIYATAATRDLLTVMLPDSAYVQQMEHDRAARQGREFQPAYDMQQALAVCERIRPVAYKADFGPAPGVRVRLQDAGHILGSAIIEIWLTEGGLTRKVVVSGDLGHPGRPILCDPSVVSEADVLLLESTYGNRDHKPLSATLEELASALQYALEQRQGIVLVPAFAVGRTQEFLYFLNQLHREGHIGRPQVFVDSPLASEVTRITAQHFELFDNEARRLARYSGSDSQRLPITYTATVQQSMALNRLAGGAIIVAASGMCDGGRIRHHLVHHLPNPRTTVLIVGFQAAGTLGRRLVDQAACVRIFGEEVRVRARVITLGGFSAHADQSALLGWLRNFRTPPSEVFLVHGEQAAAEALGARIQQDLGWRTSVPEDGFSKTI